MRIIASTVTGESFLFDFLVQLIIILSAARAGGWFFSRFGQPQVVGEIAAGLLLGPSLLGQISPTGFSLLFTTETESVFYVLGQLGLILLMFLVGLDFEFDHLKSIGGTAASVAATGIFLPFVLGFGLAWAMHPYVGGETNRLGFMLFIATALSITAIPILGRIISDFGLNHSRLGTLVLSAAAIDDVVGWMLLATISGIVAGEFRFVPVAGMLLSTVVFAAFVWYLARPFFIRWSRAILDNNGGGLTFTSLSFILLSVLALAAVTNSMGVFSIFGPFILGLVLSDQHDLRTAINVRLRDLVTAFFLPVFFTYAGLRTDIGRLTPDLWIWCGLVVLTSIVGKTAGCGLAARWGGLSWRESGCVAVMMNTRALMGLIVINLGRELGVIPDSVFSMLAIMALVTTFMTSPLLHYLLCSQQQSHFVPESVKVSPVKLNSSDG